MAISNSLTPARGKSGGFLIFFLCLAAVLGVLFHDSFHPDKVIFSNDGPLGFTASESYRFPESFSGTWFGLTWLGVSGGAASPNVSNMLLMSLGALYHAKFLAPLSMLVLGLCAWLFFRQLGFSRSTCLLAGLAAALNGNIFSHVCWGLGSRANTVGAFFLALTALSSTATRHYWLKAILAGAAVGLGIMEGADNGVIFSLYVAAFALFQAWNEGGPAIQRVGKGIWRTAMVAIFSGVLAIHGIYVLWDVAVRGVAGMSQDAETKARQWNFATQWSVAKTEMLRVVVPGLFGYRMDTPDGGNYWGSVGQDIGVPELFKKLEDPDPNERNQAAAALQRTMVRHSGAGEYAGVLVILIGLWSIVQSLRRTNGPFTPMERRWIWFWAIAALISMLLACGRYAPFYQILYALPYASTIRNPMKFMHPFHVCFVILFAYGLEALSRRYLETVVSKTKAVGAQARGWWATAATFDRRWLVGSIAGVICCVLAWLIYANSRTGLERHLQRIGFDPSQTSQMARFSINEVAWSVFFLALGVALLTWIMSGAFAGRRARWAGILIGLLVVVDLGRANKPWILSYNYKEKYASNPIIDILRQRPYEARVTTVPPLTASGEIGQLQRLFPQLYAIEWLQLLFPYNNIQSVDVVQLSRRPLDYDQFEQETFALNSLERIKMQPRRWQLTSTRYLLGRVDSLDSLNGLAPGQFRIHTRFEVVPKPGVSPVTRLEDLTVIVKPEGALALIEHTGALPRAMLFSHWQTNTNNQAILQQLADLSVNPAQTVFVNDQVPAPSSSTNQTGQVQFTHYSPKRVELKTKADLPSILLLNDRFDPGWKVWVDGKEEKVLRCNFLMRGVLVPPGSHAVMFKFKPPVTTLYVTLGAMALSVVLCGVLLVTRRKEEDFAAPTRPAPAPKPQKASR